MFSVHKRDLPDVEKKILDMVGPRDLVRAKQVCKGWAAAVRRYIKNMDPQRISDLMELASVDDSEEVPVG